MIKSTLVIAAAALSLGLASPAVADWQYWVRVCTGNDTPMDNACRTGGPQGTPLSGPAAGGSAEKLPAVNPGANPYIAVGVGN
jgi:hypothetical protein